MEIEEKPLVVTKEEYDAEQKEIASLEATYRKLAGEWAAKTTGLTLVSREEYERQEAEIRAMEKRLSELWRKWGRYAARRRWALVRELKRTAAAYLGLIRTTLREAFSLRGELEAARRLHEQKVILTPELERLRREMRETWERLEEEKRKLERKIIAEFISVEAITGYLIYYSHEMAKYLIADPDTRELLRIESGLVIETTGTIETNVGHDVPITLEITAITNIEGMDLADIERIIREDGPIESAILEWMKSEGWGALARKMDPQSISHAFIGKTVEPKRNYIVTAPKYRKIAVWIERRSRYIPYRRYPVERGYDIIEAKGE
ncbi:MAG: hypothetical protein QXX41_08925 [Nitrososphaerota archaeon]